MRRVADMSARVTAVVIGALLAASGCRAPQAAAPPRVVRFVVSSQSDVSYKALARAYSQSFSGIEIQPHESPGALHALEAIQRGDADIGLNFANLTYLAYAGRLDSQAAGFHRLRAIAALGVLPVHLLAGAHAAI